MKIFISHSSDNKDYGTAIIDLLKSVGVHDKEIIFTSNVAHGIPTGQNIFNWLKSQMNEKPFVVYLLSDEYYKSVACLNEMGAAWIIENKHTAIFVPGFDINCKEFQSGAIDPREIGFYVDNKDRVLQFIQSLSTDFNITDNITSINQQVDRYLKKIQEIASENKVNPAAKLMNPVIENFNQRKQAISGTISATINVIPSQKAKQIPKDIFSTFTSEILSGKLKEDELILLHYIIETGRVKLGTGWQEDGEIRNIKEWETLNELNRTLSNNYNGVIRRFEMRGYTEVSARTGSGNPKEVKLKSEIESNILYLPENVMNVINSALESNQSVESEYDFLFKDTKR